MKVAIHCEPRIPWQPRRAAYFAEGLRKIGVEFEITDSRERREGLPILLGTNCWRGIERDGGEFLLVDRCSFGDTERFVQLVRNGHGRRGDHRVPENPSSTRWERYGQKIEPLRIRGEKVILCGQVETYSPKYASPMDWYAKCVGFATHFRPHPAAPLIWNGLPIAGDFESAACALTLNSSIGVQCVLNGIPTITMDEGSMAWHVTAHGGAKDVPSSDVESWAHWLAWTQWTDDEIREGEPWAFLL